MGSGPYVLVGASSAALCAAEGVREAGFDGQVLLVGAGAQPPGVSAAWCARYDVELRLGIPVAAVHRQQQAIELADGASIRYDKLLLAPGARARRLDLPGAHLPGVHHLRSLAEGDPAAEALRAALSTGGRVVVVGAGWLGHDAAALARHYGAAVTLLDAATPLYDVLGPELGQTVTDIHRGHGVDVRAGAYVTGFPAEATRVAGVATADGAVLPARTVVVAIGTVPDTALATQAGLAVDGGLLADEMLRTSDGAIYAAGESTLAVNAFLGARVSVQDWAEAGEQGRVAGRCMAGGPGARPWDATPYVRSDAYDLPLEFWGQAGEEYDEVVIRGEDEGEDDESQEELLAFWLQRGEVLAGMSLNADGTGVEDLVRARAAADAGKLADPSVPLASFL